MQTSRQRSCPVLVALLLSLTIFLMLDDLLFYFWFERVFNVQLNLRSKIGLGCFITLLNLGIAVLVVKAFNKKSQTGAEGMLGESGVVVSIVAPHYYVKVHGELWRASSPEALQIDDKIVVHKITGLTLDVGRIHDTNANGGVV